MVTEVDWTEPGNINDGTTIVQPEYKVATEDGWLVLGIDLEGLGDVGNKLLETTEYEFS